MPSEALWLFREGCGRLPARAARASRAVSLVMHGVVALALVVPGRDAPAQAEAQTREQRVMHVFVPPLPTERDAQHAGIDGLGLAALTLPVDPQSLDLEGVQLTVVGSADEMLAALRAWKGAIGVANAEEPRTVIRLVDDEGLVASTEPVSIDLFWPVKVNDAALRHRFGCAEHETLYLLFPEDVLERILEDLRRAAGEAGERGSARLLNAAYGFDARRNFMPSVDLRSLRWDEAHR